jgi:FkbM family methyltransferase
MDYNNSSGIFIQVGAGAGDLDKRAKYKDDFTEFVKKIPRDKIKKIILVEPNPVNIPLLKECWKDYPESIIYNIGIVPNDYTNDNIEFYYCPLDEPHFQVASIKKTHVQQHYGPDCEINTFVVPVKTLNNFINDTIGDEAIELLAIDIEGIDAEVILGLNFNNIKLKYFSFEKAHLGNNRDNVLNYLTDNHYDFVGNGIEDNSIYDYLYINKRFTQ